MIKASEIAKFLGSALIGEDIPVNSVTSLDKVVNNSLVFSKKKIMAIDPQIRCVVLGPPNIETRSSNLSVIETANPRLAFAKVAGRFFVKNAAAGIHPTTITGNNCSIDPTASIGANCVIGDNVSIGAATILNHNIRVFDNTVIGSESYIKSGAILGEDGFGFDFEEDNTPVRLPHFGNVVIGDKVEIGANTVIARATLGSTVISNNTKIDDQVFIAHNCRIGKNTVIIAGAEISGSVVIGNNCWIGPNSSIIQKVKIGDNVTIGIGAVIVDHIAANKKIMGLESQELRNLIKLKRRIEFNK